MRGTRLKTFIPLFLCGLLAFHGIGQSNGAAISATGSTQGEVETTTSLRDSSEGITKGVVDEKVSEGTTKGGVDEHSTEGKPAETTPNPPEPTTTPTPETTTPSRDANAALVLSGINETMFLEKETKENFQRSIATATNEYCSENPYVCPGFTTASPTTTGQPEAPTTQGRTEAPTTQGQTDAQTSQGQTDAQTTQGQTDAQTTQGQGQTDAQTTQGQTDAQTTQGQTEAQTMQSQTEAPTTQGQTEAQTTQSQGQTEAQTTQGQTEAQTTLGQTDAQTPQGQTDAQTTQGQTEAQTTQGKGQTDTQTTQGQTDAQTTQGQTDAQTTQGQTDAHTTQGQTDAQTTKKDPALFEAAATTDETETGLIKSTDVNITHTDDVTESPFDTKMLLLVEFVINNPLDENSTSPFLPPAAMSTMLLKKKDRLQELLNLTIAYIKDNNPSTTTMSPATTPAPPEGLKGWEIALIVIGSLLGAALIGLLIYCLCIKKRRDDDEMDYAPERRPMTQQHSSTTYQSVPAATPASRTHQYDNAAYVSNEDMRQRHVEKPSEPDTGGQFTAL